MDKKLFQKLTGALKDAAAFERGERIDLRVAKLPAPPKPMAAKEIIKLRKRLTMSQAVFAGYLNVTAVNGQELGAGNPHSQSSCAQIAAHYQKMRHRSLLYKFL